MNIKVTVTVELGNLTGDLVPSDTMPSVLTSVIRADIGGNPGFHAAEVQRAVVRASNKMIGFLEPHVVYRPGD